MFDQPFVFKVPTASGIQRVQVRFPTDEEWIEYSRSRKVIERSLGRNRTEQDVPNRDDAYLKLWKKIAIDASEDFGAAEAGLVINRMLGVTVERVEENGATFNVCIRFWCGVAEHCLRMPTAAQIRDAERATKVTGGANGTVEYQANLRFFGELFDALSVDTVRCVPIIHKNVAVQAVIEKVRELLEDDENF